MNTFAHDLLIVGVVSSNWKVLQLLQCVSYHVLAMTNCNS